MENKKWYNKKRWLRVIITIPIALLILAIMFNGEKLDKKTEPQVQLTQQQKDALLRQSLMEEIQNREENTANAIDLLDAYQEHEVLADKNFKGKSFYVCGFVKEIKKDIMNDVFVTLATNNQFLSIQCFLKNENEAEQISKGDFITFYGVGNGLMMNVLMKNCVVVENLQDLKKQLNSLSLPEDKKENGK